MTEKEMFPDELDIEYLDGKNYIVKSNFRFVSTSAFYPSVTVPAGFGTDFASIPRPLWNLLDPMDEVIGRIAVVHDYFYRTVSVRITRDHADQALEDGMRVLGASWFKRATAHKLVRLFGGLAYKER
jgi:hypothetical protein